MLYDPEAGINLLLVGRLFDRNAELGGIGVAGIAQHVEVQPMLFDQALVMLGQLRGDRNQGGTEFP